MEPFDLTSETVAYAREMRALYRAAEQRAVRFRLLVEMGRDLVNARDIDALLHLALQRVTTFSGYDEGCIVLQDAAGRLEQRAAIGANLHRWAEWQPAMQADILQAIQTGQALVIGRDADRTLLARHPELPVPSRYRSSAAAPGIEPSPLQTWLALQRLPPICVQLPLTPNQGRPFGVLLLASVQPMLPPDQDDLDALQLLAAQLAAAILSTRLHEENTRLVEQLTTREQLLQELVERLMRAQEEEHRRIAYDLHDGLAQMLVGVLQQLHTLEDRYRPRAPHARTALERAVSMSQAGVSEVRRIIAGLRPTALDDFGLARALQIQIGALQSEGWDLTFTDTLGDQRLPPAIETALFRIAQEALSNIRKHAGSTRVHVLLWKAADAICLKVQDWGNGFDIAQVNRPGQSAHQRIGLIGMQERVALLGGRWELESGIGDGTCITVRIPLPTSDTRRTSA